MSPTSDKHCRIRPATRADAALILRFIRELAEYEKMLDQVQATAADIERQLFGPKPAAECLIAELEGEPAGFALFFHNFSTFLAQPGLYLEDLYVKPELRGKGVGKQLLAHLAKLALQRGCGRFEWAVLDWNAPAIKFYESLGAQMLHSWKINRLTGEPLQKLATEA
ncbi:MAG TPA: GNAT family N-acetyltransferase [Gammaproteobacteria bacterium]|jgi:GNAT superfamily N-acetyltransferase